MTRPDDFHACAAELQASGAQGCTTTVYRHNVRAELVAALRRLVRSEGVSRPATVLAPSVPIGGHPERQQAPRP